MDRISTLIDYQMPSFAAQNGVVAQALRQNMPQMAMFGNALSRANTAPAVGAMGGPLGSALGGGGATERPLLNAFKNMMG